MKKLFVILFVTIWCTSCTTQQKVVEVNPSQQDTHLLWMQNNTRVINYPTGRKLQNNTNSIKPKWYVPQQFPNVMVTPQFRYQSDNGFGFNGPGAFQIGN
jgi:hypothetical protein